MNEPRISIRDVPPVVPYNAFPDGSLVAFHSPRQGFATVVNCHTGELGVFRMEMQPRVPGGPKIATIYPLEPEPEPEPLPPLPSDPVKVLDEKLPVGCIARLLAFGGLICLAFRLLLGRRVH